MTVSITGGIGEGLPNPTSINLARTGLAIS